MKSDKKIAVLVGDGMADYPLPELGGRTPLEAARTPCMDELARMGLLGMARTVPIGMAPGSDTANLSIFGYDPRESYTGRAPLEALNMGIDMQPGDAAFRLNLVEIDERGGMADFSANHIETEFAKTVIDEIRAAVDIEGIEFYSGVSYRHIMIWRGFPHAELPQTTPPHDITGKGVSGFLPRGPGAELLREVMERSRSIIRESGIIDSCKAKYSGRPVSAWLWGGGRKPSLRGLGERFGLHGYTISAVDLIHGIGRAAGLEPLRVEGTTGYLDTNYEGKARALLEAMGRANFVLLHVESPDESGHEGNLEHKIRAIEDFDEKIVGRVMQGLSGLGDYALLVMPDHPTPIPLRTHTGEPVPFCIYGTKGLAGGTGRAASYSEREAEGTGILVEEGHRLIEIIINEKI